MVLSGLFTFYNNLLADKSYFELPRVMQNSFNYRIHRE